MAEPRRIIPSRPSAQRLSDDIGDVLGTIRRLIAEDEALSSARDRLRDLRDRQPAPLRAIDSATPPPDPGEAIAHRHGGNAALARALAGLSRDLPESAAPESPANAPEADASASVATVPDTALPDLDDFAALMADADYRTPNDLARRLSATFTPDGGSGPLRLEQPLPSAQDRPMQGPLLHETPPASASSPVDFDEDFDWKAHMRPDLPPDPEPAPIALRSDIEPSAPPPADHHGAEPEMQGVDAMNEEETIREWLREMIREELLGELGQRFSRNLRSLIRREVAVTIDDQLDRL